VKIFHIVTCFMKPTLRHFSMYVVSYEEHVQKQL